MAGFELAKDGYRPVPLYNTTSGRQQRVPPNNCVLTDVSVLVQMLCVPLPDHVRNTIVGDNPPAFLLDSRRLRGEKAPAPGVYDNRWMVFPQDFPSAKFLQARGDHAGRRHQGDRSAGGRSHSRAPALAGGRHHDPCAGRRRRILAPPGRAPASVAVSLGDLSRPGADGPAPKQRRRVRLRDSDPGGGRRLRVSIAMERRKILVTGRVQGVGFRPTVHRLATELELTGFVFNDARGVTVELQGRPQRMNEFLGRLTSSDKPPLAQIKSCEVLVVPVSEGEKGFVIRQSQAQGIVLSEVSADVATCGDCLRELGDSRDFRHRYPFINCTNCGPRYSIIKTIPYDRPNTTMSPFEMCERCAAQYRDVADRRFHAQPVACPQCGPKIWLTDPAGKMLQTGTDEVVIVENGPRCCGRARSSRSRDRRFSPGLRCAQQRRRAPAAPTQAARS